MPPTLKNHGHVLCSLSGVLLVRYGPSSNPWSRYEVIEPDHVATFSRVGFAHPLQAALSYFLDHANWYYMSNPP